MKTRIDQIDANPFRHIDRYPIREDKIAALRESIATTGFWDNLVGREVDGRIQIAYGHHRREALLREFPADYEIGTVVRDFTDDQMLQIMARENMEEWGSSAAVEHETVRAVVEAYGAGLITLDAPDQRARADQLRYAPSFAQGDVPHQGAAHAYTAMVAYLGGPLDGFTERRDLPSLDPTVVLDERYLIAAVTPERVVFEWQPEHTGRRRLPDCTHEPHSGCPLYRHKRPGATP